MEWSESERRWPPLLPGTEGSALADPLLLVGLATSDAVPDGDVPGEPTWAAVGFCG